MEEKVQELRARQRKPLHSRAYRALVLDGIWFKKRKQKKEEVLLVALGVRLDGSFEILDWSVAPSESSSSWEKLLNRISQRGLQEVELVVADEAWGIWEALDTVYPEAKREVCLWHLGRNLERMLQGKGYSKRRSFRKSYWQIFEAQSFQEAQRKLELFCNRWQSKEPAVSKALQERKEKLFAYLSLPYSWRQRVRTINLGENFFKHLRTFLRRFPGLNDEQHIDYVVTTYLLSLEVKRKAITGKITPINSD